jgi:TrpR family transcriptional regulator, trp operon repressor
MDVVKKGWKQFLHWCHQAENEKQLDALFDLVLTHEEKSDIATRCLIIKELLAQEESQRDIAKNLNVSIAKITRGSNELKRMKAAIIQYVKKNLLHS